MRNLDVGQNQNIGIGEHPAQEDVIRTTAIKTAGGLKLYIGLICDGESPGGQSPEVFQQLAAMVVRNLEKAAGSDVCQIMADSLNQAHLALRARNENQEEALFLASVTLVAIQQKRLFLAHSGSTRAYLVRGETAVQLTQDHLHNGKLTGALGINPELKLSLRPVPDRPFSFDPTQNSLPLKPGDAIVLCSDGLVKERPDNRGALLDAAKEMPPVLNDRNMSAVEAARTLVSLAVGRRADDNVSAVIMRLPRQNRGKLIMALAVVGLIGLAVLLFALRMPQTDLAETAPPTEVPATAPTAVPPTATIAPTSTPTPGLLAQDNGYASVQIRGSSGTFEYMPHGQTTVQAITPSTSIEADDRVFTGQASQLQLILNDGTHLFLGPSTELHFIYISPAAGPESGEELPTTLALEQGELLLQQAETSKTIVIQAEDSAVTLGMVGTLAIMRDSSELAIYCFAGTCDWDGTTIAPGQQGVRLEGVPVTDAITMDERSRWNGLCHCLNGE